MVWGCPSEFMCWKLNPQSHMLIVCGGGTFGRWLGLDKLPSMALVAF
jgi:hypothetical protein